MMSSLFSIIIFPGFLFLAVISMMAEFLDRKIYARLQNRVGPPWFQAFADFIKLISKEDIVPQEANQSIFRLMPIFSLASAGTAFLYIPLWSARSIFSFNGDIIVVLYLLTLPTFAFFIGGWYSTSLFARIGSVRSLTQLFSYEVPLFMGILSPALLANSWSLSKISLFYNEHPLYFLFNIIGFGVSLIALLGKLEKTPFDIPEAETEVVAGSFTEYSGRLYAFIRLTLNMEMVCGASLLAAIFLPFGLGFDPWISFVLYLFETAVIIALLAFLRTIFARLRIDQMVRFCWKYLVPMALLQLLINFTLKEFLL